MNDIPELTYLITCTFFKIKFSRKDEVQTEFKKKYIDFYHILFLPIYVLLNKTGVFKAINNIPIGDCMKEFLEIAKQNPDIKYMPILLGGVFFSIIMIYYILNRINKDKKVTIEVEVLRLGYNISAGIYFLLVKRIYMLTLFFCIEIVYGMIMRYILNKRIKKLEKDCDYWTELKVENVVKELVKHEESKK